MADCNNLPWRISVIYFISVGYSLSVHPILAQKFCFLQHGTVCRELYKNVLETCSSSLWDNRGSSLNSCTIHANVMVNTLKIYSICATYLLQCKGDNHMSLAVLSHHIVQPNGTMCAHVGHFTTLEHWEEEGKGREG